VVLDDVDLTLNNFQRRPRSLALTAGNLARAVNTDGSSHPTPVEPCSQVLVLFGGGARTRTQGTEMVYTGDDVRFRLFGQDITRTRHKER